ILAAKTPTLIGLNPHREHCHRARPMSHWVRLGSVGVLGSSPLCPDERTLPSMIVESGSCQERTWAPSPPQGRYTRNAVTMPCGWLSDCGGEAMSCLIARARTTGADRRTLTARHRVVISDTARTAA